MAAASASIPNSTKAATLKSAVATTANPGQHERPACQPGRAQPHILAGKRPRSTDPDEEVPGQLSHEIAQDDEERTDEDEDGTSNRDRRSARGQHREDVKCEE